MQAHGTSEFQVLTEKTVPRDFETGMVQPGPGTAPTQPPAEDEKGPGAWEECRTPKPDYLRS